MNKEQINIDIDAITIKHSLRHDSGDLASLESSIRKLGLLAPVIVDQNNILISGSRRLAASRAAGLTQVPAIRVDVAHDSMAGLDIQSDENLCRLALSGDELEKHISRKQAVMKGKSPETKSGFRGWLKTVFAKG